MGHSKELCTIRVISVVDLYISNDYRFLVQFIITVQHFHWNGKIYIYRYISNKPMCHILTELFGTKSKGYMSYKFTHLLVQVLVEHLRQKDKKIFNVHIV